MLEKRKYQRVDVYWNVTVLTSAGQKAHVIAKNVSYGGMYVESKQPADKGSQFWLGFQILCRQGLCKVRVKAEVVHCVFLRGDVGKIGMGLRFIELDEESSECLQTFLKEHGNF